MRAVPALRAVTSADVPAMPGQHRDFGGVPIVSAHAVDLIHEGARKAIHHLKKKVG